MKKIIILLSIIFLFNYSYAESEIKDSIYILKNCDFLKDSANERYYVTPIVKIDTITADKNSPYDTLPIPLKTYKDIEHSITFLPVILKLFLKPELEIIINIEIKKNGSIGKIRFLKQTYEHFEQLILDSLRNVLFKPAIYKNEKINLNIIMAIKIYFNITKYIPDTLLVEKDITSLSHEIFKAFNKFIAEKHISNETIWQRKAEQDIVQGKARLFMGGMVIETEKQKKLAKNYGFEFIYTGCITLQGYEVYNNRIMEYLNKINGNGWYQKFWEEYVELGHE